MTKKEFAELPYNKRCWLLTKTYFAKCTDKDVFLKGKPTRDFFIVRSFFMKQEPHYINQLWNYLGTIEFKPLSLTDLFRLADVHNKNLVLQSNKNQTANSYNKVDLNSWLRS